MSTGIPTAPATNATTISECNCVIFRLDGVQDYHGKSAQLEIMDTFLNKSQSLSLGMIMNSIGNDTEIVNKILEGSKNGLFELSVLGWNFSDYSKMSQREQNTSLYLANQKVGQLFGQLSNVFIPPYGNFNKYTPSAMNNAGLEVLSSFPGFDNSTGTGSSSSGSNSSSNTNSGSNSSSSQYTTDNNNEYNNNTNTNTNNTNTNIYHFPAMISFSDYDNNGNIVKVPIQQILNETDFNISKYGYAVISLDTEFFINSQPQPQPQQQPQTSPGETTEEVKTQEIKDLSTLIDSILSKGISIQNF